MATVTSPSPSGTVAALPPSTPGGSSSIAAVRSSTADPVALLDSLDAYTSNRAATAAALGSVAAGSSNNSSNASASNQTSTSTTATTSTLDPVDFINRHYTNEHALIHQLPSLRIAVHDRMDSLEDRISTALQRQSETSVSTRRHVQDAKSSILSLEKRIRLVQQKAGQSERAVLEITKDMKRLDCAKRHLQKTITTLKRLHMLVHAVEQLRLACLLKPHANYKSASQLVDATRLLLKHFDAYTAKVEPMRLLSNKVTGLQFELENGLVRAFRIVGFGVVKAMEMEDAQKGKNKGKGANKGAAVAESKEDDTDAPPAAPPAPTDDTNVAIPIMPPQVMSDGTLLIDSLGADVRVSFIKQICTDHLQPYEQLFVPQVIKPLKQHSFKIQREEDMEKPPYVLEQVDRRFAWYRRTLREVCDIFPSVFPTYWNFQHNMTVYFLEKTKSHLFALLSGATKDKDSDNATILLKALQKTILFEKEMMAWLQRDFGTVFLVPGSSNNKSNNAATTTAIRGDHGEELEFDESGRAVAADSAQGIRIKYERQKKEQLKGEKIAAAALDEGRASVEQVPVEALVGVASSAFDNFMSPYIALEEQSMDEHLVTSLGDSAVDTRGEMPVFTSSTGLFVYIKGSITRCTAMTKGKAFYLLFQAFQDSLNKYAQILSGKLPQPAVTAPSGVGGLQLSLGGNMKQAQQAAASTKAKGAISIPRGDEVKVCHVISTCEYCADTVEALEDLIRDTIEEDFKDRIDMSNQQEHFHDVTAKCIQVLVSGLMTRMQEALRVMNDTNWATFDMVGEESSYVRKIQTEVVPFVAKVRGLIPSSYFRSFCDKFATAFTSAYYNTLVRLKRISEMATQQLLLDCYNLKTAMLKLPVVEATHTAQRAKTSGTSSSIAPAMYTKMVTRQFKRIETLLKLVGTPTTMLIDVFRVQWPGGSALDLQVVMGLKGLKRNDQAVLLEKIGLNPQMALRGATAGVTSEELVAERMQELRQQSTKAAAKVSNDLSQMRQKVDDFRRAFR